MSETMSQKPVNQPESVIALACYGLGYLTGLFLKTLRELLTDAIGRKTFGKARSSVKRALRTDRSQVSQEILNTPTFVRKGKLSVHAWEKQNLSPFTPFIKPVDSYDLDTALAILAEDEQLLWPPTSGALVFDEELCLAMVYEHVFLT